MIAAACSESEGVGGREARAEQLEAAAPASTGRAVRSSSARRGRPTAPCLTRSAVVSSAPASISGTPHLRQVSAAIAAKHAVSASDHRAVARFIAARALARDRPAAGSAASLRRRARAAPTRVAAVALTPWRGGRTDGAQQHLQLWTSHDAQPTRYRRAADRPGDARLGEARRQRGTRGPAGAEGERGKAEEAQRVDGHLAGQAPGVDRARRRREQHRSERRRRDPEGADGAVDAEQRCCRSQSRPDASARAARPALRAAARGRARAAPAAGS